MRREGGWYPEKAGKNNGRKIFARVDIGKDMGKRLEIGKKRCAVGASTSKDRRKVQEGGGLSVSSARKPTANEVVRRESHAVSLLPSVALRCHERSIVTTKAPWKRPEGVDRAQRWQSGFVRNAATPRHG